MSVTIFPIFDTEDKVIFDNDVFWKKYRIAIIAIDEIVTQVDSSVKVVRDGKETKERALGLIGLFNRIMKFIARYETVIPAKKITGTSDNTPTEIKSKLNVRAMAIKNMTFILNKDVFCTKATEIGIIKDFVLFYATAFDIYFNRFKIPRAVDIPGIHPMGLLDHLLYQASRSFGDDKVFMEKLAPLVDGFEPRGKAVDLEGEIRKATGNPAFVILLRSLTIERLSRGEYSKKLSALLSEEVKVIRPRSVHSKSELDLLELDVNVQRGMSGDRLIQSLNSIAGEESISQANFLKFLHDHRAILYAIFKACHQNEIARDVMLTYLGSGGTATGDVYSLVFASVIADLMNSWYRQGNNISAGTESSDRLVFWCDFFVEVTGVWGAVAFSAALNDAPRLIKMYIRRDVIEFAFSCCSDARVMRFLSRVTEMLFCADPNSVQLYWMALSLFGNPRFMKIASEKVDEEGKLDVTWVHEYTQLISRVVLSQTLYGFSEEKWTNDKMSWSMFLASALSCEYSRLLEIRPRYYDKNGVSVDSWDDDENHIKELTSKISTTDSGNLKLVFEEAREGFIRHVKILIRILKTVVRSPNISTGSAFGALRSLGVYMIAGDGKKRLAPTPTHAPSSHHVKKGTPSSTSASAGAGVGAGVVFTDDNDEYSEVKMDIAALGLEKAERRMRIYTKISEMAKGASAKKTMTAVRLLEMLMFEPSYRDYMIADYIFKAKNETDHLVYMRDEHMTNAIASSILKYLKGETKQNPVPFDHPLSTPDGDLDCYFFHTLLWNSLVYLQSALKTALIAIVCKSVSDDPRTLQNVIGYCIPFIKIHENEPAIQKYVMDNYIKRAKMKSGLWISASDPIQTLQTKAEPEPKNAPAVNQTPKDHVVQFLSLLKMQKN